jgi:hypothetical protein
MAVQLLLKGLRYWLPHMLVGTLDIAKQIMSRLGYRRRIAMPKSAARGVSVRGGRRWAFGTALLFYRAVNQLTPSHAIPGGTTCGPSNSR